MNNKIAKPFVKWAGGKTQILKNLECFYPVELTSGNIKTYIEPFVGGGAVLFYLLQKFDIKNAIIIDINKDLINCYKCIKNDVYRLIKNLEKISDEFFELMFENRSDFYYKKRIEYNNLINQEKEFDFYKAAIFIFLNKTCFNGLYRVNSKNEFNVPFGKYKKPLICDKKNLTLINKLLQKVDIIQGDYKTCKKYVSKDSFVYFDPPYRPISKTQAFVEYSQYKFDDDCQKELAIFAECVSGMGAYVLLSNSDPKNIDINDDFFDVIYKDFNIKRIMSRRVINSNGKKRGAITELIVSNF